MGKVTFYYVVHGGKGVFNSPGFRQSFREADVVDFETAGITSRETRRAVQAIAAGDRAAYEKLVAEFEKSYRKYGAPEMLFGVQQLKLIFNSKKRIEFEGKLRGRARYRGRVYRLFPGIRAYARPSERRKLVEQAVSEEGAEWARELLRSYYRTVGEQDVPALMRAVADSERIARKAKVYPGQNRLVIRGEGHSITTPLVRRALRKNTAVVEEIHMPVHAAAAGAPPAGDVSALLEKARKGKPIMPSEILRQYVGYSLFNEYVGRGWSTAEAVSQSNFIAGRIPKSDLRGLVYGGRGMGAYLERLKPFQPWWKAKKARP
jgi:hypothetical protein